MEGSMSCLSLSFLQQLIIWVIVIAAIVAVIRLLIPHLDSLTGVPIIGRVLEIVLWVVVAIMVVYLIFGLLGCLLGSGGGLHLPR
jgi:hypothetical protein